MQVERWCGISCLVTTKRSSRPLSVETAALQVLVYQYERAPLPVMHQIATAISPVVRRVLDAFLLSETSLVYGVYLVWIVDNA